MARTQAHRPMAFQSPLGEDALLIRRLVATEQFGRLSRMTVDLLSEDPAIRFQDLLGRNVSLRLSKRSGPTRYFNGYVSRFVETGRQGRQSLYQATVVPWLWFLTRTADCRIFQNLTAPQIIKQVFQDHKVADLEDRLNKSYRQWEYCVQYRETDFNFVSRLMEQEGIYYYFAHGNGRHALVLADSRMAHEPYPGYEQIPYRPPTDAFTDREHIYQWAVAQEVQPGAFALTDFDFKNPRKSLRTSAQVSRPYQPSDYEMFDFPGEYEEFGDGEQYARLRIEELQAQQEEVRGETDAYGLAVGHTFQLTEFSRQDQCRNYLVTAAEYEWRMDEYDSTDEAPVREPVYVCRFRAIDANQPFRTPRTTPRPLIRGPQTAIVVGPKGEEVWTDEYGRVKVQFHWDRYGKADENSSCWIRVAQVWAGKKWGGMYIPRIGQEVIVEFLEGDPDRPIITGRVYNGAAMPPYDLPAAKTMSTLKSNSSKGGDGFNEIRFEDKKGQEQIFVHGEKDEDIRIKNDGREWIGRDRHLIVKRDQMERVEGDKHGEVKGDRNEKIGGSLSEQIGADSQHKVGQKQAVEAGTEIHLKAGQKVVIEAGMQLTIKAAGGFVDIGPAGVTIQGTLVRINSGGAAGSGSGCSPDKPTTPKEADDAKAGKVDESFSAPIAHKPSTYSSQAMVMKMAAQDGASFCAPCAAAAAAPYFAPGESPGVK